MKNFTCTKCGSNKLREEGKNYICEYCGATILKPFTLPRKRLIFIIASLGILLLIAIVGYNLLYSIKTDIEQIKYQAQSSQTQVTTQQNTIPKQIPASIYQSEENPFSDVILKVEGGYSTNNKGNSLEKFIRAYQSFEMNKACYISLNKDGEYAFGYTHGAKSTKIAEEKALEFCQKEKNKRNLSESCIPYAVNNHISRLMIDW